MRVEWAAANAAAHEGTVLAPDCVLAFVVGGRGHRLAFVDAELGREGGYAGDRRDEQPPAVVESGVEVVLQARTERKPQQRYRDQAPLSEQQVRRSDCRNGSEEHQPVASRTDEVERDRRLR